MLFVFTTQARLPDLEDTIVALSSAAGAAARAIVRLSGRRAAGIVAAVCPDFAKLSDRGRALYSDPGVGVPTAATLAPSAGRFLTATLRLPSFHALVPADVYHFAAPRSYTGQDVVEVHTISCQPIVDELIVECLNAGARAAQPGEFTMRAFLAGKLDLTRAEAVLGVIEAADRHELHQALTQLAGGMAAPMHELREDLLNLLADVEAGLDFTEDGIYFVATDALLMRLGKGLAYLTSMRRQIEQRALGQRPFRAVLAGKPNAGKSSLFNALVGCDAALVSANPGTTRDYLEKYVEIDGVALELVDTAGLCETDATGSYAPAWEPAVPTPERGNEVSQAIEVCAQTLGKQQSLEADLILWCIASDEPAPNRSFPRSGVGTRGSHAGAWGPGLPNLLPIATKTDLGPAPAGMLATSARTGRGVAELGRRLAQEAGRAGHAALAPSLSRCRHHVEASLQHLGQAHAIAIQEEAPELLALELRLALEELGAMAGAVYTDDLLDRIFSRFCIGK